ncbi:MAG: protein phosphatase 2C domain-containing protein [Coriobacteriales bacterium]|jgi:serine/threonine protein phosphatase PrpC
MIRGCAITSRGIKTVNDDKVLIGNTVLSGGIVSIRGNLPLVAAVFDGVSQGYRGAEASNIATSIFLENLERITRSNLDGNARSQEMKSVFDDIQHTLLAYQQQLRLRDYVATTASGIIVDKDWGISGFNSGDSRVYRFRNGNLFQMSSDDTLSRQLEKAGMGDVHIEMSGLNSHTITKALGVPASEEGPVTVEDYGKMIDGDIFLGCSDGLSGFVDNDFITAELAGTDDLKKSCRKLFRAALDNGSNDNISLFIVQRVDTDGEVAGPQAASAANGQGSSAPNGNAGQQASTTASGQVGSAPSPIAGPQPAPTASGQTAPAVNADPQVSPGTSAGDAPSPNSQTASDPDAGGRNG